MFDHLRRRGKEFGIVFGDLSVLSNSRLSLEASEYARDMGKHEQFQKDIFHAYFTKTMDIGDAGKLCDLVAECGLDAIDLMHALKDHRYQSRLDEARKEGLKIHLTGVPTFIINDRHKLVGAQPVEVFTDLLDKILRAQD